MKGVKEKPQESEVGERDPEPHGNLTVNGLYLPEPGSYLYIEAKGKWAIPAICVGAAWLSFSASAWW